MQKFGVVIALEGIREARAEWKIQHSTFNASVDLLMRRLLHEAARNYMSAEEVAKASGFTISRVRILMRQYGLDPKTGKRLLSEQAAKALRENAELMGIEPHQMDLTSPLAYLPMGEEMRRELQDKRISDVKDEFPETTEHVVYVLTNSDNPEGPMYEGVFPTADLAKEYAREEVQERKGELVWETRGDGFHCFNEGAGYGTRELDIREITLGFEA